MLESLLQQAARGAGLWRVRGDQRQPAAQGGRRVGVQEHTPPRSRAAHAFPTLYRMFRFRDDEILGLLKDE